jgi:outer membrane protein OmpA-like peptidoglycan-associated protein
MNSQKKQISHDEDQWLSVSDLMAGLMMVFLFIAIALMREAMVERDKIKNVAVAYQENQVSIYNALKDEFEEDLDIWKASLNKEDLTFTFKSPDTLFKRGDKDLQLEYKEILNDFFPRYLNIILKYKKSINEVRIEGHTSSVWNSLSTDADAYFKNMKLSQGRTRSVLEYIYNLNEVEVHTKWIKKHIAAVGFSSSKVIIKDGIEDKRGSRRVSFRVITNSEIQIRKILEVE